MASVVSAAIALVSRTMCSRVVAMSVEIGSTAGAADAVTVWVILVGVANGLQPAVAIRAAAPTPKINVRRATSGVDGGRPGMERHAAIISERNAPTASAANVGGSAQSSARTSVRIGSTIARWFGQLRRQQRSDRFGAVLTMRCGTPDEPAK